MNRRRFIIGSAAGATANSLAALSSSLLPFACSTAEAAALPEQPRVAILPIDMDAVPAPINDRIYGHFLEHINHSVEDGLFAEQIRGAGFEGNDFADYWQPFAEHGGVDLVSVDFQNGSKSVRLRVTNGRAGIGQRRIFLDKGVKYEGSLWAKREGSPELSLQIASRDGRTVASLPLGLTSSEWQAVPFSFTSPLRDTNASLQVVAAGTGAVVVDFVSMMRADVRHSGMFRPDLFQALHDLRPSFIRWPGGSFASTYKWREGIGRYASRGYHPNTYWGGYSDYFGFGTDEFLELCRKLNSEPLIVLPAPGTRPEQVEYAMNWVRYLNDPVSTEWGRLRAANGHPEPYEVRLFQIDNEPMNNGFTPEAYADIVNVYGSRLRVAAPGARIVACGQKRSNDMRWSEKVIDLAGQNFDILGCHNYEYEPENFESGIERIRDYLTKLQAYVRRSRHPRLEIAVLEWSLQHTYDWRSGLHTAGSLILYEELSPGLSMTCPALLMRNTSDDPTWTSFIYHDHVSWFPGAGYVVEKLFREHYAERYLASATGSFKDRPDRTQFFKEVSTSKPEGWMPGTVDAIATASADGRRIVIKAVNYKPEPVTLLAQLQGKAAPDRAVATLHTISAKPADSASLERPDAIKPVSRPFTYSKDLAFDLGPYTVAILEINAV